MITAAQLLKIFPFAGQRRIAMFIALLEAAMAEFGISTPARQASFLSQVGHESGQLQYVRELASGDAYEGRRDLGNTQPGDGRRYRGRGLIHRPRQPRRVRHCAGSRPPRRARAARASSECVPVSGVVLEKNGLNELADTGDQVRVTRRVNGGTNGWPSGWCCSR